MRKAIFYLLEQRQSDNTLTPSEELACTLAAEQWREGKRVLLACADKEQAQRLDDYLWQHDPLQFVPHSLAGVELHFPVPIELCWPDKRSNTPRDLLITLLPNFADFATSFLKVIDFVPYEESQKKLARERYKAYRHAGFHLNTVTSPIR